MHPEEWDLPSVAAIPKVGTIHSQNGDMGDDRAVRFQLGTVPMARFLQRDFNDLSHIVIQYRNRITDPGGT